jgi:hypothetical protein
VTCASSGGRALGEAGLQSSQWRGVEFNVFGNGSGSQTFFDGPAKIDVRAAVDGAQGSLGGSFRQPPIAHPKLARIVAPPRDPTYGRALGGSQ